MRDDRLWMSVLAGLVMIAGWALLCYTLTLRVADKLPR